MQGRKTAQEDGVGVRECGPAGCRAESPSVGDRHRAMGLWQLAARGRKRRRGSGPAPECRARSSLRGRCRGAPPGGCIEWLVCPRWAGAGHGAKQEPVEARKTNEKGFAFVGGLQDMQPGLPGQLVPSCLRARHTVRSGVLSPSVSPWLCPGHGSSAAALPPPASQRWHGPASLDK